MYHRINYSLIYDKYFCFSGGGQKAFLTHWILLSRLLNYNKEDKQQQKWAEAVNLIFPNQEKNDRGAHMNISGGGVAIHSKNKDNAIMLLEFLSEEMSQNLYGKINFEYPVNPSIEPSEELAGWGIPIEDKIPIIKIAELGPLAQKIIDRVGW